MTTYPQSYHAACNELVHFGASRPERAPVARRIIARALRDLRRTMGHERARNERRHMLYISGHFPDKITP
jgi:hypothetical protein